MNERPTPETDANLGEWDEGKFWDHPKGRIVEADFARQLERERDELRTANAVIQEREAALVASKDRISQRAEAIRCELVESEKKSEAMREAIREAHTQIRYAEASFAGMALRLHPADPDNDAVLARTGNALAKLNPFTTP
jgi:hypothetical protein